MAAMAKTWLVSLPVLLFVLLVLNHSNALVEVLNGQESPSLSYSCALLLQILLFFLFVECFYHVERSVTLRLLVEIQAATFTGRSVGTIMKDYSVDEMISRRLDVMLRSGLVRKTNGKWNLTSKGEAFAKIMSISCWIFQSKPQNERL